MRVTPSAGDSDRGETNSLHRVDPWSRPTASRLLLPLAFGAVVAGAGAITAVAPPVGLALGIGAACTSLLRLGQRLRALFLVVMAGLLIGYAFFGKTFAYLGVPPIYVGEAVLGLGLLSLTPAGRRLELGRLEWLLIAFAALGALRTAPYVGMYGIDALRDAVVWGYALFAFAVANALEPEHFRKLVGLYRRVIPYFLLWVPLAASITLVAADAIPTLPGTDVPLLSFKGGDAGVHLAGIGAFVVAGFWAEGAGAFKMLADAVPLALWFIGAAAAGAINRGGLLASTTACVTALMFRPSRAWLYALAAIGLIAILLTATDPDIGVGGRRVISIGQLQANVANIFSSEDRTGSLEGTKQFRLQWWSSILDYTVSGPYFWTGKGFGVNLADDDGFQVTADHSLRSPHNSHFSILARMGVPGFLLWAVIQVIFGLGLLRAFLRARRAGSLFWSRIDAWLLIYWLAALVNMSFDVYLEGPQGGIWFWTIFGIGLAALRLQRTERADRPDAVSSAPSRVGSW